MPAFTSFAYDRVNAFITSSKDTVSMLVRAVLSRILKQPLVPCIRNLPILQSGKAKNTLALRHLSR